MRHDYPSVNNMKKKIPNQIAFILELGIKEKEHVTFLALFGR